ncbi:MAG: nucleotidyltransferase family protein [Terriglobia bacterium]
MLAGLAPEDELCLLLARGQLPPDVQSRALGLLADSLRWDALMRRAEEHQVLPLIYRSLQTLQFQGVPKEVQAKLKAAFRVNAIRNMLFAAELSRVLHFLGEAGMRVMPLKGVALAELLYGDPACRVCYDIDIFVPASDALRARRVLLAQGYTSPFAEDFFVNHQFRTSADCPLVTQKGDLAYFLELHWTLFPHSSHDADATLDLWSQARPREFFGTPAYNPTPEWQFLYLAGHAAYHRWQTLKWVADIHDLCVSASIDWHTVQQKATRFDLDFVVGSTLAACSALYGTPAPANFPAVALPAGVQLFPHSLKSSEAWSAPLFYPQLLKRRSEKLRWFLEMFFVARQADEMFFHLPASLDLFYYLLRPLRLTCKWSWLFLSAGLSHLRQRFRFSSK